MGRGMRLLGGAQVSQLALQLVSVAVLARLLTPDAFGLVAMILVVVGVADLFRDMGLSNAAIQAQHLSVGLRSNLFWANTGIGACLTLLVAACAPLIAALYDRPRLIPITLALAPTFLLSGLATQYRVHLVRELRFKALAFLGVAAPLIGLLAAVAAALGGLGVWALVVQSLTSAVATLSLLILACRWLPGRPRKSTGIRGMLRLGSAFLASSLLTYVRMNADSFIIGQRFGPEALGLYNRSVQVIRTPIRQAQQPFGSVVVPVAARAGNDDELMRALSRLQPLMGYGLCALAAVVAAAPGDVVLLALGDQWLRAAPVMAVVAASAAVAAVGSPVFWLYTARGMGGALLGTTSLVTVLTIILIAVGAQFGLVGAALGYLASTLVSIPITFVRAEQLTGLPMIRLGLQCTRPVVLLGVVWASSRALSHAWQAPAPAGILVAIALVVLISGGAAAFSSYRTDYRLILESIRTMR